MRYGVQAGLGTSLVIGVNMHRRTLGYAIPFGVILLCLGCSSSTNPEPGPAPPSAPGTIRDLRGEDRGSQGVMLRWSAPTAGSAAVARYDVRLSGTAIADSNWAAADTVAGEPVPAAPGSPESLLVGGLDAHTTYDFAIRSVDSVSRESSTSNNVSLLTTYGALTSITSVIENLRTVWNDLDYDEYARILDPSYTFVFAPQDVGGPNNIPDSWGLADELLSARHLYSTTDPNVDGYVAHGVSLTFVVGPEIPNDIGTWTKVVLSSLFLTVSCREEHTADPLDYLVQGDQANLWFAQVGSEWRLVQWQDIPITTGVGFVSHSTFGQIKGLWR
jgi:hypothetical protein